jgi:hypothetical protein
LSTRDGPLWRWNQPGDCWNLSSCFMWSDYDGIFDNAAAGLDVMIDAREIAPPWAAAKNDSGPTWSEFPGPDHYADWQRWLEIMLDRYGPVAVSVEVSNEDDGLTYFQPQPIPYDYAVNLSLALINITAAAIANTPNASGLTLVGLSTSMFDVKQLGNGGSTYLQYEKDIVSAPGVLNTLQAYSPHPYANQVWVPWLWQPWGNESFLFPNEPDKFPSNSTVAQVMAIVNLLKEQAQAQGGFPDDWSPSLHPSEFGYNLAIPQPATGGWAFIHGALVAQGLIHMRSLPLATYVKKVFVFAAYDGCCEESNGFFGIWRPSMLRTGANATATNVLQEPASLLGDALPLPATGAYAAAAYFTDVPSGRAAGVFVIDNTISGATAPAGQQLPPSCVAFEDTTGSGQGVAVLWIVGHHFNDRTTATVKFASSSDAQAASSYNGFASPMPIVLGSDGVTVTLTIAPLPQYLVVPHGVTAASVCSTLAW